MPTIDGGPVKLRLPAGHPHGRTFRVKGRGVATAKGTGDLLVTVEVAVPTKLSDAERAAVEALAAAATESPRATCRRDRVPAPPAERLVPAPADGGHPMTRSPDHAVYVISVAAELAGVHPQTLRIYERKGLVDPARTQGGSRRYSDDDIALLRRIQDLTNEGLNLAGVQRVLELEAENQRLRGRAGPHPARRPRPRWPRSSAATAATWSRSARRSSSTRASAAADRPVSSPQVQP